MRIESLRRATSGALPKAARLALAGIATIGLIGTAIAEP